MEALGWAGALKSFRLVGVGACFLEAKASIHYGSTGFHTVIISDEIPPQEAPQQS